MTLAPMSGPGVWAMETEAVSFNPPRATAAVLPLDAQGEALATAEKSTASSVSYRFQRPTELR
jgi:hypothetical protein